MYMLTSSVRPWLQSVRQLRITMHAEVSILRSDRLGPVEEGNSTLIHPSSEPETNRVESAVQKSTLQMRLSCASYSLTASPVSTSHSVTQPS